MFCRPFLLLALVLFSVSLCNAREQKSVDSDSIYPVIPGDFADPSVIRVGDTYYAVGTSSEWAPHFPMFVSKDLKHWQQKGYVFDKNPEWTSSSFWAPELLHYKDLFYVYYTARRKGDGQSFIGVATTPSLGQPFTDHGIIVEFGKEAIDAFIIEEKGKRYLTFKAYGLDNRPIELLGYELSEDGLKVLGEPFSILRDDERKGMEGQCIVKRGEYFYLLYSAGGCCGAGCSYHVNLARSKSVKGPYEVYEKNPLLAGYGSWKCTGHGTIVTNANGEDFYLYHAYSQTADVFTGRQGMLAKVEWNNDGWPAFEPISGEKPTGLRDDFTGKKLNQYWQWDFRHASASPQLKKGELLLDGQLLADNPVGTVLTIRPVAPNYAISTQVTNENDALKGLTIYGDANAAVGLAVQGHELIVWSVNKSEKSLITHIPVAAAKGIHLRIQVSDGSRLKFSWSPDAEAWNDIDTGSDYFDASFLPPWDRSPRPGLSQQGNQPACFEYFRIDY